MPAESINLLSMAALQAALKIKSRQTIHAMIERQELPPPCIINRRGLRWRESDIAEWVENLNRRPTTGHRSNNDA